MNTSYRSTSPILEVVDHVFSHTPINLSDTHALKVQHHEHRKEEPGRVALWPLVSKPEREEFIHEWALPITRMHEDSIHMNLAQHIAEHIQKLLKSMEILPSTGKPIEPQDILILVEKRSHMIQHLASLLSEISIPVESSSKLLLKEQLPIMDFMALGRFLINPEDDYSLACILKSPLINDGKGISEETLLMLCYDRHVSLWQRLEEECPKLGIEGDYKFLESLLKNVDWSTPFELFTLVVNRARGYFMARFGASINALLNAFLEACIEFEQKNPATLEGFLNYLEASELNFKTDILGASGIRIMTVHGSKGLQAPVVILADSTDTPKPHLDPFLFFEDKKLFLLRPSQEEQTPETEPSKDLHAALLDSENKRLLYVALTRAQDQLYLTGIDRGKLNGWYGLVAKTFESLETKIGEDGTLVYEPIPFEISSDSPQPSQKESLKTLAAHFDYTPLSERASNSPDSETIEMARGTQVHKLLELNYSGPLNNYLPWLKLDLEDQDIKSIEELKHNPKFECIFGSNSQSEVELYFSNSLLRIDRVVELEKEVHIIDFKTHGSTGKIGHIPNAYREQLKLYGQALQPFYPKKQIRLFLLWTDAGDLVEI
jgi:ATP-dependent helicase/nuclease subunit A